MNPNRARTADIIYHRERKKRRAYAYRLLRRTQEVLRAIQECSSFERPFILDLGAADCLMLEYLLPALDSQKAVAVDLSWHLLSVNRNSNIVKVVCEAPLFCFKDETFDVVVGAAFIEHVPNLDKTLDECHRLLKTGGLLILTTPAPFFERVARFIGHLPPGVHFRTYSLKEVAPLLLRAGFAVVKAEKFMLLPTGMPKERQVERLIKRIKADFLLLNQLVVAQKFGRSETSLNCI